MPQGASRQPENVKLINAEKKGSRADKYRHRTGSADKRPAERFACMMRVPRAF